DRSRSRGVLQTIRPAARDRAQGVPRRPPPSRDRDQPARCDADERHARRREWLAAARWFAERRHDHRPLIYLQLAGVFALLSLFSFGGGGAIIPQMYAD